MSVYGANFVGLMRCEGGNVSLGTAGAVATLTGTNCAFIGANTSITSTTFNNCVLIGSGASLPISNASNVVAVGQGATVTCTGNCVAIGEGAVVSTPNSIVFGSPTSGLALYETGYGHQKLWTRTLYTNSADATLTGSAIAGGWIAFEGGSVATMSCYLPTFASLAAALPNVQNGTTVEFIISNFTGSGTTAQWRLLPPAGDTKVNISYRSSADDYVVKNTISSMRGTYLAAGQTDGRFTGECFVFYL